MAATSSRVRRIVELVAELSDEERAELDAELQGEDEAVGRAWGEEIDRRAARALLGDAAPLSRSELADLLNGDPTEARTRLSQVLSSRR